jgi:hypothetical protein
MLSRCLVRRSFSVTSVARTAAKPASLYTFTEDEQLLRDAGKGSISA